MYPFVQILETDLTATLKVNGIAVAIEFCTDLREHCGFFLADTVPPLQVRGDVLHDELSARRYTNRWRCG
jgi:hypothetical protein